MSWRLGQRVPSLLREGRLLLHRRVLGIMHEARRIHCLRACIQHMMSDGTPLFLQPLPLQGFLVKRHTL